MAGTTNSRTQSCEDAPLRRLRKRSTGPREPRGLADPAGLQGSRARDKEITERAVLKRFMDVLTGDGGNQARTEVAAHARGDATEEGVRRTEFERERSGLYRKLLKMQLREVLLHLRVTDIERPGLTKANLRSLSARFDIALDALTGTSRRDRALVWLDQTMLDFAAQLQFRGPGPPRRLRLSAADREDLLRDRGRESEVVEDTFPFAVGHGWGLSVFGRAGDHDDEVRFAAETVLRLPWFDGPLDHDAVTGYLDALLRRKRGRPPGDAARRPTKWELFHELAVRVKLWDPRQSAEDLARTVRRARRQLRLPTDPQK